MDKKRKKRWHWQENEQLQQIEQLGDNTMVMDARNAAIREIVNGSTPVTALVNREEGEYRSILPPKVHFQVM